MSKSQKSRKARRRTHGVRPFWSGTLSFGLVSVPVQLFPAQRRSRISMRMVAPDGTPLERRYYCPEHERDVHQEHLIRGYPLPDGSHLVIRQEELDSLEPQKSREIDLRRFVDLRQIPPQCFDRCYYLTPSGDSNKAYRLLAEVMERSGRAGIASFVMRDKEYLVAIISERGILAAQTLRMQDEIRTPEQIGLPPGQAVNEKRVKQLTRLVEYHSKAAVPDDELSDVYANRLEELVQKKLKARRDVVRLGKSKHVPSKSEAVDEDTSPTDLLATIRRSLSSANKDNGKATSGKRPPRSTASHDGRKLPTKEELYEQAQRLQISGRSQMTKDELVKAIRRQRKRRGETG